MLYKYTIFCSYGDIYPETKASKVLNGLFITVNVFLIAVAVSNILGYIVDAGEEKINARMAPITNGMHDMEKEKVKMQEKKIKEIANKHQSRIQHLRSKSTELSKKLVQKLKVNSPRRKSQPAAPHKHDNEEKKEDDKAIKLSGML